MRMLDAHGVSSIALVLKIIVDVDSISDEVGVFDGPGSVHGVYG